MGSDQNFDWKKSAASALDWWHDAGIEWLTGDEPRNWVALSAERSEMPVRGRPAMADRPSAPPPLALPNTLLAFEQWRLSDQAPDAAIAGARVGSRGAVGAPIMVIVDTPDRGDDAAGCLLSGATGRLFDNMMAAIGLSRDTLYIAPMCVVRPPATRLAPELEQALGVLLRHHIGLVAAKRLLIMANAPSRALLGADIATARGSLHFFNHADAQLSAIATFHPRFLLERPAAKAEAWKDLQLLASGSKM